MNLKMDVLCGLRTLIFYLIDLFGQQVNKFLPNPCIFIHNSQKISFNKDSFSESALAAMILVSAIHEFSISTNFMWLP